MNGERGLSGLGGMVGSECWQALATSGRPGWYAPGATLMNAGEEGRTVLVLVRGRVKIRLPKPEGFEVPIAVRHAGEVLGEMSVLNGRPRTATVVAIDECVVRIVAAGQFRQFVADNRLDQEIARLLMARLQDADLYRAELVAFPLGQRVCRALLRFGETVDDGGFVVDLNMSQEEFGGLVGASRNAVGLVLARLRELGVVDTSRRRTIVLDLPALRLYAERGVPGNAQKE